MVRQRSVFDIVGPVMIGPSSSHTAGACRLGALALAIFGSTPKSAHILLHGSFASTGPGHGTDFALVAGLLGMRPMILGFPAPSMLADEAGLSVSFAEADLGDAHPNTAVFELEDADGHRMSVRGSSLGGGDVVGHRNRHLRGRGDGRSAPARGRTPGPPRGDRGRDQPARRERRQRRVDAGVTRAPRRRCADAHRDRCRGRRAQPPSASQPSSGITSVRRVPAV